MTIVGQPWSSYGSQMQDKQCRNDRFGNFVTRKSYLSPSNLNYAIEGRTKTFLHMLVLPIFSVARKIANYDVTKRTTLKSLRPAFVTHSLTQAVKNLSYPVQEHS